MFKKIMFAAALAAVTTAILPAVSHATYNTQTVIGAGLSWEFPTEVAAWNDSVNTCPASFPNRYVAREVNGRFAIIRFPAGVLISGAAQHLAATQNYHPAQFCIEGIDVGDYAKLPFHAITLLKEFTPVAE